MPNPWKASKNVWKTPNPFRALKGWWDLNHVQVSKKEPEQTTQSEFAAYNGQAPFSFRSIDGLNNGEKDVPVQSSAIQKVRFDEQTNTTYITFVGGDREYAYNTTPEEMREFLNASSKGRLVSTKWNHNPHFRKHST